jgi:hypothetical protein
MGNMTKVGDLADALVARLNASGSRNLHFWGAPGGFAVVVPLEPIDDTARPIARRQPPDSRLASIEQGPVESILQAIRRLLSEPIRDSRILLMVVTTDGKLRDQQQPITADIARDWERGEYMPPTILRHLPLTASHHAAAFVYEFHRDGAGEPELVPYERRKHTIYNHLAASDIRLSGLLE